MLGGGSGGHAWSPRLARGTGRPQLEHFTVGRTSTIETNVEEGYRIS